MTRTVGHRILDGYIEVFAHAKTIPEALALESAMKFIPVAEAFQPVPLPPAIEALIENAEAAEETVPQPMSEQEARNR